MNMLNLLREELVNGYFNRDLVRLFLERNAEQIATLSPQDRQTLLDLHATITEELKYCPPAFFEDPDT